jgi:hypothetical protein
MSVGQLSQTTEETLIQVEINSYELPSEGPQAAVLADVIDLGLQDTAYGKKMKVRFVYVLAENDSNGREKRAFGTFTKSLNEKARLRKHLSQLGVKFGPDTKSVDIEALVGQQVTLVLAIEDGTGGKQFANIVSVMKPAAGQNVAIPDGFVRAKDRVNT